MTRRLYVLDFDRTLADTNKLNDAFMKLIGDTHPTVSETLHQQMRAAEQSGASFVTLDAVRGLLSPEEYDSLLERFAMYQEESNYQLPGVEELLAYIRASGSDAQIVSYGDAAWQELKARASGLAEELPFIVVSEPRKSAIVLGWKQDDGTFLAPGAPDAVYDEVIVVDDKAKAFEVWGSGLIGYWVRSSSELLPSQRGEVSDDVHKVHSLYEVGANELTRVGR